MKVPKELETETYIKILLQDFLFQESNFQINDNKFFKREIEGRQQMPIFTHYKVERENAFHRIAGFLSIFLGFFFFFFFSSFFFRGLEGGSSNKSQRPEKPTKNHIQLTISYIEAYMKISKSRPAIIVALLLSWVAIF